MSEQDRGEPNGCRNGDDALRRAIIETMAEAVVVLDGTGNVLTLNPAFAAMHGYGSLEEAYASLWHFADVDAYDLDGRLLSREEWPAGRAMRGQTVRGLTIRHHNRQTGHSFVGSYSAVPVWADGVLTHVVITVHDLTRLVQVQDALRVTEDQLRHRIAELAEADRQKDEFLALLSHELRNPLAAITNALYLLDRQLPCGTRPRQLTSIVARQTGNLARLLDDLLDLTRLTRGMIEIRPERLDLVEIARRAVETIRPQAQQHDLRVELSAVPLWLDADPVRLEQVIVNFLTNAVRYTEPGGKITIGAERAGEGLVLCIRDTGIGIAPELLGRIFEPFTQADRSHARSQNGLGVGLTLVRRIVELHGGTVTAASEGLGCGSEFTVRLPGATPPEEPVAPCDGSANTVPATGRRVLVIEDNQDAAETLQELLELAGHTVALAFNGAAGVRAALEFRPDVVLCDLGLPGLDGYSVARELHAIGIAPTARVIAVTGFGQPEDVQRTREAGFHAHVTKPASWEELSRLLAD